MAVILISYVVCNKGGVHNPFKEALENSFYNPNIYEHSRRTGWHAPNVVREAIELNVHAFFSAESFMIVSGIFPAYIGAWVLDKDIQSCFYDARSHKNCCQLPWWCHDLAKIGIGIPIIALGSLTVFGKTDDIRTAGRVFLVGMPFVIFGKDIIKQWGAGCCLRPKNGDFCKNKKYYGGFPSGHMAEATYIALLAGIRFGAKAAIPLTIFSLFVAGAFINCNRHYTSQIVAGAAFGAMYALAANKVIEHEIAQKMNFGIAPDCCGNPSVSIEYTF